jgi:hypothetical protein
MKHGTSRITRIKDNRAAHDALECVIVGTKPQPTAEFSKSDFPIKCTSTVLTSSRPVVVCCAHSELRTNSAYKHSVVQWTESRSEYSREKRSRLLRCPWKTIFADSRLPQLTTWGVFQFFPTSRRSLGILKTDRRRAVSRRSRHCWRGSPIGICCPAGENVRIIVDKPRKMQRTPRLSSPHYQSSRAFCKYL